jgi:hypothetical protein
MNNVKSSINNLNKTCAQKVVVMQSQSRNYRRQPGQHKLQEIPLVCSRVFRETRPQPKFLIKYSYHLGVRDVTARRHRNGESRHCNRPTGTLSEIGKGKNSRKFFFFNFIIIFFLKQMDKNVVGSA